MSYQLANGVLTETKEVATDYDVKLLYSLKTRRQSVIDEQTAAIAELDALIAEAVNLGYQPE